LTNIHWQRQRAWLFAFVLAGILLLPWVDVLDEWFADWRMHITGQMTAPQASPVAVVAIDEATLDNFGPWPWPRTTLANVLEHIVRHYQPAAIGLDIVFPPNAQHLEDVALAKILQTHPIVVGQLFDQTGLQRGVPAYQAVTQNDSARLPEYSGVLASSAQLGVVAAGHINGLLDHDGKMRRAYPYVCGQHGCSPSLAARVLGVVANLEHWTLSKNPKDNTPWLLTPDEMPHLALALDQDYAVTLPWRATPGYATFSLADLWHAKIPTEVLTNKILIIGATAHGMGDKVITPINALTPGVEAHATLLTAWLDQSLPRPSPHAKIFVFVILICQAVILLLLRNPWHHGVATMVMSLAPVWLSLYLYQQGWIFPVASNAIYPWMLFVYTLTAHAIRRYQDLILRFSAYLPEPLVKSLTRQDSIDRAEVKWTTCLYADIMGYTHMSQQLAPEKLAAWCNQAIDLVVVEVGQHQGMVDNIAGDGLLAYWRGQPAGQQAQLAFDAALSIQAHLLALNRVLAQQGLPPVRMGIGMHAGPLMVGSFGAKHKRRYTLLGDVANIAARIEQHTRQVHSDILFSQAIMMHLSTLSAVSIGPTSLKGISQAMILYQPAPDPDMMDTE
jgi:adenylate cyclase